MQRIVVVGASSGLGRAIGAGLAREGARVAFLARRADRIAAAAEEAGPGALAIACDVTDESSCRAAIDAAAAGLGGIDGLVYAAGVGSVRRIADVDAATWRRTLDTNVTGAAIVTAAAIRHLTASGGAAAYLSSVSASMTPPWPGIGPYVVSKAALDKLVDAWRAEHPSVGFTRVVIGNCGGGAGDAASEFARGWDMRAAGEFVPIWSERGYVSGSLIEVDEVVRVIRAVLVAGASASIPSVTVVPRAPRG